MRCTFIKRLKKNWEKILFEVEFLLNIAANIFIERSFFDILYDQLLNDKFYSAKKSSTADDFVNARQLIRDKVMNVIALTQIKMFIYYDKNHKSIELKKWACFWMIRREKHEYKLFKSSVLTSLKLESYKIEKWVNQLTYRLKLSSTL